MLRGVVTFTLIGLLLIALSIPLIRRRVPPNAWYGLRVPPTFADETVWYDANARSGRELLWLGIAICALALLLPIVPGLTEPRYVAILAGVALAGVIALAVVGWSRAARMRRARQSA